MGGTGRTSVRETNAPRVDIAATRGVADACEARRARAKRTHRRWVGTRFPEIRQCKTNPPFSLTRRRKTNPPWVAPLQPLLRPEVTRVHCETVPPSARPTLD